MDGGAAADRNDYTAKLEFWNSSYTKVKEKSGESFLIYHLHFSVTGGGVGAMRVLQKP
jgi:hypothetical protein